MYITEPSSTVTALDVRSGRRLCTWTPAMLNVKHIGLPAVNRGVAILDDTVYVGTLHAPQVAAVPGPGGMPPVPGLKANMPPREWHLVGDAALQ
jgi:hypothetical protein